MKVAAPSLTPMRPVQRAPAESSPVARAAAPRTRRALSPPLQATVNARRERAEGPGLVHISTSDKCPVHAVALDRKLARQRRLRTAVITAARLHDESLACIGGGVRTKWAFLTLTMRPGSMLAARDISDLVKHIRGWMTRKCGWFVDSHGVRFVWVMEMTKAGAPHYHALVLLPHSFNLPKPDKQGWWKHGKTKIERARNAVGYIAKYASKADSDHEFPKGMRTHGVGGLDTEQRRERRWWLSPKFFRDHFGPDADIRIAPGGRINRITGEYLAGLWCVVCIAGAPFLVPRVQT